MRTFLRFLVQELAFESVEAEDGCQGIEALKADPGFEAALVDWDMPRMNGLEFVRAVRGNSAFDNLKIMMVTTQTSMEHVAQALAAGATDFLMKPVSKESLEEKLLVLGVLR